MNYLRTIQTTMIGPAFLLVGGLFVSLAFAQESKQVKADWVQVRRVFDAYFSSPTEKNALRVLTALPDRVDDETTDYKVLNSTIIGIYHDHIRELSALVDKGDRLALRIVYNYAGFTDGFFREQMDALIGYSIVVMPEIFLEETLLFRKNNPRSKVADDESLEQILCYFIDFDAFRPEVISKEINARIKALEKVERKDLLEFRDDCLKRLRERLKSLRRQTPGYPEFQAGYLP